MESTGHVAGSLLTETANMESDEARWAAPEAQHAGSRWVYDTFTPPEIFYDERSKQFTVDPPDTRVPKPFTETLESPSEDLGVRLIAVIRELYPLQLVGFVATDDGSYAGVFQNLKTGETRVEKRGAVVPTLGLALEEIAVRREEVAIPQSMNTRQLLATARVRDLRTGQIVMLDSRERLQRPTPHALVEVGLERAAREIYEGDSFEILNRSIVVGEIKLEPPSVALSVRSDAGVQTRPIILEIDRSAVAGTSPPFGTVAKLP